MQLKSRHKTIVLAPTKKLESYVAICICLLKERTIVVYEFDENSASEAVKDFHKVPDRPAVSDSDCVVNGGVPAISWYIDARYPHPPLFPGDPKSIGHRVSFCNILNDRVESLIEEYLKSKDKDPLVSGLAEILSANDDFFNFDSMKLNEYNYTDAYFCALLHYLEEIGINLSVFSGSKSAYKYVLKITSSTMYNEMIKALATCREKQPFYDEEGYNRELYSIPA